MKSRQSGTQTKNHPVGTIHQFRGGDYTTLHGARVRLIDNRSYTGGVLVQVLAPHNGYVRGERVIVGPADFVADKKN